MTIVWEFVSLGRGKLGGFSLLADSIQRGDPAVDPRQPRTNEEDDLPSLVVLMMEAEQPEGLSARKLVVETAKHNVLTAYCAKEGLRLLERFPAVDAVLVHGSILENHPEVLSETRELAPDVPIILAAPFGNLRNAHADFIIDSHNPQELLRLLTTEIEPRPRT